MDGEQREAARAGDQTGAHKEQVATAGQCRGDRSLGAGVLHVPVAQLRHLVCRPHGGAGCGGRSAHLRVAQKGLRCFHCKAVMVGRRRVELWKRGTFVKVFIEEG